MKKKNINIGEYIKNTLSQMNISQSSIAEKIGVSKQTLAYWLKNDDIYVKNICMISEAIGKDLLIPFLLETKEDIITDNIKVSIQIEIDPLKHNDVLKHIADQQLYNLLKSKK